mgnify:CR=1 FL=1
MVYFGEFLKPWIRQNLVENAKIQNFKCDILSNFQTLWQGQRKKPWDLRWELDKNQNNHKTMISFCSFLLQFVLILQCACEMSPLATSLPFFASPRINVHSFAFNEQRSFKAKKCKREDWIYAFLCCNKSFLDTFRNL